MKALKISQPLPNEIVPPVYYMNTHWAVTSHGIESLTIYYPIPMGQVVEDVENLGKWSWPQQIAGKAWASLPRFILAHNFALRTFVKPRLTKAEKAALAVANKKAAEMWAAAHRENPQAGYLPNVLGTPDKSGRALQIRCPYCDKTHTHGLSGGHRAAHCASDNSDTWRGPNNIGYSIVTEPEELT